jgi:putative intracellular protease/amidase
MATKSALVLLAEGAEEMELVISVDILRRVPSVRREVTSMLISFS